MFKNQQSINRSITFALSIALLALVASVCSFFWSAEPSPRIAFVRLDELVMEYRGMGEVRQALDSKKSGWQQELDTLQSDYRTTVSKLGQDWKSLSQNDRAELQKLVTLQRGNLERHTGVLNERMEEEQQRMVGGILSQVKGTIEAYAQENDLSIVLGVTSEGSVLYGETAYDITDELLVRLNTAYGISDSTLTAK